MTILVTGATGNVGAHVVRALRAHGVTTRAFVRDSDKVTRMFSSEVELAPGDFADRASLEQAMRGVDALFLACANVPDQVVYECRAIDVARECGVRRIVKLSGPAAALDSPLVFERWHAEIERYLTRSGVPSVVLRPSTYMTNLLGNAVTVAQMGMLFAPAGAARISYIDPRDVAAAAASALIGPGHAGHTYRLTGPAAITFEHIARDLSAAIGKHVEYVNVPDDAARQALLEAGLPPFMADAIIDVFASFRADSMVDVTDTVRDLTGRPARPFAEFARDHAELFEARAAHAA